MEVRISFSAKRKGGFPSAHVIIMMKSSPDIIIMYM